MMDSLPHQTQGQQNQHQAQPNNDVDLGAGSYNYPNHSQNDAFNSYFNNHPASSFNAPWGTEAIDPRIQPNAFAQTSPAWHHNALNGQGHLQTPDYGLQPSSYNNAYTRPQDAYPYSGYHNQQPLSFANNNYDPALTYGTDALLDDAAFVDHGSHGYGNSDVQGQTISPSALQSFAYPQFSGASDDQIPQSRNDARLAPQRTDEPTGLAQRQYDDRQAELISASIPSGVLTNDLSIRDATALVEATKSVNFTGFVFLGGNTVDSDDRVILPKTVRRRSLKDLKRQIRIEQGNEPWTKEQQPLAKKLRLTKTDNSVSVPARSSVNGSGVQNKQESSSESASESGSDDESDYESDSDEQPEVDIPDLLQSARPTDPVKAIEYDVVETVWRRTQRVEPEEIRSALGRYEKLIKELRDKWKQEENALAQAEGKKDQALVEKSKARAATWLQVLENACRLTVQYGHQDIVGRLGEIPLLFLAFSQLLLDRIKNSDESGTCVTNVLQLMTRFDTINQKGWEGARVEKTLVKLAKRSNEKTKVLVQQVLDEAEQYLKDKSANSKSTRNVEVSKDGAVSMPNRPAQPPEPVSTLKRQRDTATPVVIVPKKSNSLASSRLGPATAAKSTGTTGKAILSSKTDGKTSSISTAASTTAPKIKVNHVVAKPSVFASLQSASKKPGTSLAALKAAQQSDGKGSKPSDGKAAVATTAAAAPKPTFSFAETMANLTKPKEAPSTTKAEENLPPETAEEKKKRLRKEERRKLRVSFKPDDSLTEVRIFVHDPEEEMGHDDSMIRDVGDVGGEGRMLKMHKDLEGLDEDEDGTNAEEVLATWNTPSLVDFSVVETEELARNCSTRGGKVEVRSSERAVQEQRELTVLMAFYTSLSDVPLSPREPVDPYSGEASTERMFGTPSDETKTREAQYYMSQNRHARPAGALPVAVSQAPDISALLQILNSQQQAAPPPQQYQTPQSQPTGLEAIFAQFSGNKPVVAQPAVPQQFGLLDPSIQAALAAVNGQNYGQQTYTPPAPPVQSQTPDLQALLSQLGQVANPQQQSYNYQNTYQSDGSRKRQYNYDEQRHDDQYSAGKFVRGNNGKKFFGVPTVPCRFWQEGKCKKGDECTFLHE